MRRPSCEEIDAEANRVYDMTRQQASVAEVFSYLLAPAAGIGAHDERRKAERDAETVLDGLLELAQLHSCEIAIRNPRYSPQEQIARVRVAQNEYECVKPNGVRVYTIIRSSARTRRVEVYSIPPKGPTIVVDKAVSELPDVAQLFLYTRACEAHRQGWQLRARASAFIDYVRHLPYNCAAIRNLKRNGMLPAEEFSKLIDYAKNNESAGNYFVSSPQRMRMDDALTRCFTSEEFEP